MLQEAFIANWNYKHRAYFSLGGTIMIFYNLLLFIQIGGRVLHRQAMLFTSRRNFEKYVSRSKITNPEEWNFLLYTDSSIMSQGMCSVCVSLIQKLSLSNHKCPLLVGSAWKKHHKSYKTIHLYKFWLSFRKRTNNQENLVS